MEKVESDTITLTDTSQIAKDLAALYLNKKFSDVTLVVDGTELHAHGVILSSRSEYFAALLYDENQKLKLSTLNVLLPDASPECFRHLLQYIYTGTLTIPVSIVTELMGLARKLSLKNFEPLLVKNIVSIINMQNVSTILNMANLYSFEEVRDICHHFMDQNACEILETYGLSDLSQISLIKLLERDNFLAPEIEIFKSVAKWCHVNNCDHEVLLQCVRLSWLSVDEILSVVWPSKLIPDKECLQIISEINGLKPRSNNCRYQKTIDENLATPEKKAELITGENREWLLTGNRNVKQYCKTKIGDKNGVTIKLGFVAIINYIEFMLCNNTYTTYRYYIEVSTDGKKWKMVIDYRQYSCHSVQKLYIEPQIAKFVRIVGTYSYGTQTFCLVYFETYFKSTVLKTIDGLVCSTSNVFSRDNKEVILIEGSLSTLSNSTLSHGSSGSHITIQLPQPYRISHIKFYLWEDKCLRSYTYYVEISIDNNHWIMVADKRNEMCKSRSLQVVHFAQIPVVYIRITGTSLFSNDFRVFNINCDNKFYIKDLEWSGEHN